MFSNEITKLYMTKRNHAIISSPQKLRSAYYVKYMYLVVQLIDMPSVFVPTYFFLFCHMQLGAAVGYVWQLLLDNYV